MTDDQVQDGIPQKFQALIVLPILFEILVDE